MCSLGDVKSGGRAGYKVSPYRCWWDRGGMGGQGKEEQGGGSRAPRLFFELLKLRTASRSICIYSTLQNPLYTENLVSKGDLLTLLSLPSSLQTLNSPDLTFPILSLIPNPTGKLVAVVGAHQLVVLVLPRPGYINLVAPVIECRFVSSSPLLPSSLPTSPLPPELLLIYRPPFHQQIHPSRSLPPLSIHLHNSLPHQSSLASLGSQRLLPPGPHPRRSPARVRPSPGRRGTAAARFGRSSTRRWIKMAFGGRAWGEGRGELLFGTRRGRLGSSECLRSDGERRHLWCLPFLAEERVSVTFILFRREGRTRAGLGEGASSSSPSPPSFFHLSGSSPKPTFAPSPPSPPPNYPTSQPYHLYHHRNQPPTLQLEQHPLLPSS